MRAIRRAIIALAIAVFVFAWYLPQVAYDSPLGDTSSAVVTYVYDGDTIEVELDGERVRVRLLGIDAPEIDHDKYGKQGEPFGDESLETLKGLVNGARIDLEYDERRYDQYGRTLAYVWLKRLNINEEMLNRGMARVLIYKPNVRYQAEFERAERAAKQKGLGLWGA